MKHTWNGVVAMLAVMSGLVLHAQSGSQERGQTPAQGGEQNPTIKVAGCLQTTKDSNVTNAGPTATSGQSSSKDGAFILANASVGSGGANRGGEPGGSASATGSTPSGPTGRAAGTSSARGPTYTLDGSDEELTKHVGHQVEVTGTLGTSKIDASRGPREGSSAAGAGAIGSGGGEAGTASAGAGKATARGQQQPGTAAGESPAVGQRLHVTSVRMISSNCSGQ
jgi:hypothetical protein